MAAPYPIDYPFNVDNEGWPEHVYAPPYPFEYYYDNGRNSHDIKPKSEVNNNRQHRPNSNYTSLLAIRRHTAGSTDPSLPQLSSRNRSPTINPRLTTKRNPSKPTPRLAPIRNHSSTSLNPDERPIKPMKDTSVYNTPSPRKNISQPKKPPPITPPPIQSSPRYESKSFRAPSSRNQISNTSQRRPIRIDLIPKTSFGVPSQRNRSQQIIVEEYDGDDDHYPRSYVSSIPEKVVSYQKVSGMTTRELENYHMSKARRLVHVRTPPVRTIIYRT